MKRVAIPQHDPLTTYDTCVAAVGDLNRRVIYQDNREVIDLANIAFDAASDASDWSQLPRFARGDSGAMIGGTLTKKQMMDLYTLQMVGSTGPSREIYDNILVSSGELCPLCGDLGHARTLDHFLPKSAFPIYSVHPRNLVPCCRDCNSGKNAYNSWEQTTFSLHPYLDARHFFDERWVRATAHRQNPVLITFDCDPPIEWSDGDKSRVNFHFREYKIGSRFSIQCGSEISKIVDLRFKSLRNLSTESFRAYLLENANCAGFVLNGWSRTMYAALAETDWFTDAAFESLDWLNQEP